MASPQEARDNVDNQNCEGSPTQSYEGEDLHLSMCHACALQAAGYGDDGTARPEGFLDRRRLAYSQLGGALYSELAGGHGLGALSPVCCQAASREQRGAHAEHAQTPTFMRGLP